MQFDLLKSLDLKKYIKAGSREATPLLTKKRIIDVVYNKCKGLSNIDNEMLSELRKARYWCNKGAIVQIKPMKFSKEGNITRTGRLHFVLCGGHMGSPKAWNDKNYPPPYKIQSQLWSELTTALVNAEVPGVKIKFRWDSGCNDVTATFEQIGERGTKNYSPSDWEAIVNVFVATIKEVGYKVKQKLI
jgi:hypothetical protein